MLEDYSDESFAKLKSFVNADLNPVHYLSIDPGKSNGVCGYDSRFYLQFMLVIPSDKMVKFLNQFRRITNCVVEDYRLYPNKAKEQYYSDMETPRIIGQIEGWAELYDVNVTKQPASIKPTAYKWLGKKPLPKTNPLNHALDAHVHGIYWGVRNKIIDPTSLIKRTSK